MKLRHAVALKRNLHSDGIYRPRVASLARRSRLSAALIEPGSPWENGYCASFNGKLRDECLNGEIFYSLREAQIVIEQWQIEYNTRRPHSALYYCPPATETIRPGENSTLIQPNVI